MKIKLTKLSFLFILMLVRTNIDNILYSEVWNLRLSKEERREEILKGARKVFIQSGFKGATTLQIAKAANVSEMTLFRYFKTKESIFKEAINPLIESLEATLKNGDNKDFKILLKELLADRLEILIKHKDLARLVIMESYLLKDLEYDLISQVISIINKHFPPYLKEKKGIMVRLIIGFVLSFIFLPNEKADYEKELKVFLENVLLPLCEGGKQDA